MSEGVSRAQRENNSPGGVCGRGEGPTEMTLGASTNVPTRLVSAHGRNQLRLRRESPKDTGGDNHRVSTPAYSACAQLVGSSQFRHEEDESEDLCPTEGNLVPKNVCAGGISESFSESRWRQDRPVTR